MHACMLPLYGLARQREAQIAIKTSERDDLAQPENQDLLSPAVRCARSSPVRPCRRAGTARSRTCCSRSRRAECDGRDTLFVMETKGAHLANEDTEYKRRLLAELERAFRDERMRRAGELELIGSPGERFRCGLVFDENWKHRMHELYFGDE